MVSDCSRPKIYPVLKSHKDSFYFRVTMGLDSYEGSYYVQYAIKVVASKQESSEEQYVAPEQRLSK